MTRRSKWLVGAVSGIVLLLAGVVLALLHSDWVLRQAVRSFAPDGITIETIEGDASGPIAIRNLTVDQPGLVITVDRAALRWQWSDILSRRLHVVDLEVGDVTVVPRPDPAAPPPSDEPFRLPESLDFGLDIVVDRLAVNRVEVGEGESSQTVQNIAFRGSLVEGRLAVERARAEYESFGLSLNGSVDSRDQYAHSLVFRVLEPDSPPVEATLRGNLATTTLTTEAPAEDAELTLAVEAPLAQPSWRLDAKAGDLTRFAPITELRLEGSGDAQSASLTGGAVVSGTRIDLAQADLSSTDNGWRVDPIRVGLPEHDASAVLTGLITTDPNAPLDLVLAVAYPPREADARFEITGAPSAYDVVGRFQLDGETATGSLQASGSTTAIDIESLRVEAFDGVAALTARADWESEVSWRGQGELDSFNPAALAPQWPGRLNARLQAEGDTQAFEVVLSDVSGSLRQRQISGEISARRDAGEPIALVADVRSGRSRVNADARVGEALAGTLDLDVADAGDFYPGASGSAQGQLAFQWRDGGLTADGGVQARKIGWEELRIATVDLTANQRGERSDIALRVADAQWAEQTVNSIAMDYAGTLTDHQIDLQAAQDDLALSLTLDGGLLEQAYRGKLSDLMLRQPATGEWSQGRPADVRVSAAGDIELEPLCLQQAQGELCFGLAWGDAAPRVVQLRATTVDLALASPFLSAGLDSSVDVSGSIGGRVRMESVGRRWSLIDVELETSPTTIAVQDYEEPIDLRELRVMADGDESSIRVAGLLAVDESRIELGGDWEEPFAGGPMNLRLHGDIPDFGVYDALVPQLADLAGQAAIDVAITGPVDRINPSGSLQVQGLGGEVLPLGLVLKEGSLRASWQGGEVADVEGSIKSGDGVLNIGGQLGFVGGLPRADLTIRGERVRAVNLPSMQVIVSPDLNAEIADGEARLTGSVEVPEAEIQLAGFGQGVSASGDVVVVDDEDAEDQEPGLPVYSEIDLSLGDDVKLQGFGLDATVTGNLHISEAPDRPTRGRGELRVAGEYAAYGQQLEIERGRILFSDTPLDDPGLDIRAARKLENVEAGVQVQGRVSDPTLEVYSVPPMEESEALSWLVLGRSLRNAGASEDSDMLGAAALSLGLKGGNKVASAMGSNLGFTELGFSSKSEVGGAAFSLGRYLSPKLYISYSVGLLESINLVQLQYTINDKWALESQVGEEAKGVVKYRIERGR